MSHFSGDKALCPLPEQENSRRRRGCSKDRSMFHWGPSEFPSDFWRCRSAIGSEGRRRIVRLRRSIVRDCSWDRLRGCAAALRTPPKSKRKGPQKTSLLTASAQGRRNITGTSTGTSGARSRPSLDCVRRASSQTRNPPLFTHSRTRTHARTRPYRSARIPPLALPLAPLRRTRLKIMVLNYGLDAEWVMSRES